MGKSFNFSSKTHNGKPLNLTQIGGSRNPGKIGSKLYSGQTLDPGFRRGDDWKHAITFGKHYKRAEVQRKRY